MLRLYARSDVTLASTSEFRAKGQKRNHPVDIVIFSELDTFCPNMEATKTRETNTTVHEKLEILSYI
jgi:hypothetical protein